MTEATARLSWGHVNINVSNLERSIAFYEQLGFSVFIPAIPYMGISRQGNATEVAPECARALDLPVGARGRACIMQLDDGFPKIDLTEYVEQQQTAPLSNKDLGLVRICLVSSNLARDYEELTASGIPFLSPPAPCKDSMADVATCVDPDGTLIELLQVYLERWPRLR